MGVKYHVEKTYGKSKNHHKKKTAASTTIPHTSPVSMDIFGSVLYTTVDSHGMPIFIFITLKIATNRTPVVFDHLELTTKIT